MDKSLQHHGILGQKWGVRRFQNADGTLTPAGKTRYGVIQTSQSWDEKIEKPSRMKQTWDEKLKSPLRADPITAVKGARESLEDMTDEELRKKVDRMVLENKYKDAKHEDIERGKKHVASTFDTINKIAVAGTATIALAIAINKIVNK